ncbi:MAG: hypothetical protein U1F30_02790 [Steroidobacteraceae bacterium]
MHETPHLSSHYLRQPRRSHASPNSPSRPIRVLLLLAMCSGAFSSRAEEAACQLPQDAPAIVGHGIPASAWTRASLPERGDVARVLDQLDVDGLPEVYREDLDADGAPEYILVSPPRVCGNGGCPYVVLDGRTLKRIADVFGHVAILDARVNGYRVLQAYSHQGADLTALETYVFDHGEYRLVTRQLVDPCSLALWSAGLKAAEVPPSRQPPAAPAQ